MMSADCGSRCSTLLAFGADQKVWAVGLGASCVVGQAKLGGSRGNWEESAVSYDHLQPPFSPKIAAFFV